MASNLSDGFATYPMVEEAEATGAVAGVHAQLLTRMPFLPNLFKSFTVCPPYLVLAYEQAAGLLDGDELTQAGQDLEASVRDVVQPPEQEQVRHALATFVGPLGRMLLLSLAFCWRSTASSRRRLRRARRHQRDRSSPTSPRGCRGCARTRAVRRDPPRSTRP